MEYSEMATTLRKLEINYRYRMLKEQKDDWYRYFKNCDYTKFAKAIDYIIKNNKYFPNVKEINDALNSVPPKWFNKIIKPKPLEEQEKDELNKMLQSFKK